MKRIRGVLIDLSGTLHVGDKPIKGAVAALQKLTSDSSLGIRFLTNTTKENTHALVCRLEKMGFSSVNSSNTLSALRTTRDYIWRYNSERKSQKQLRPFLLVSDSAKEEFKDLNTSDPNCVVVGLAPKRFDYPHINAAFRVLLESDDPKIIAMHKAKYYMTSSGLSMGPGGIVSALEYSAGMSPEQTVEIGKPQQLFFRSAVDDMKLSFEDCVMIGDDAQSDYAASYDLGMSSVLVQTGKYRSGDEDAISSTGGDKGSQWFSCVDSFVEAVDLVLKHNATVDSQR